MMNPQEQSEALVTARYRAFIEETLFPPHSGKELSRTAQNDFKYRFGSDAPHIAELFQENTKLSPFSTLQPPVDDKEYRDTKKWYFSTPYRMKEGDLVPGQEHRVLLQHNRLCPSLQQLLAPFSGEKKLVDLLYSVDLFLLENDRLFRQVPNADFLWFEKKINSMEKQLFRSSMLGVPSKVMKETKRFLILAGAPWRYMMFFGPRGYRRMMFDAGHLIAHLERASSELGLDPTVCLDYYDFRVDCVLNLDGTERTTLAIMSLQGGE